MKESNPMSDMKKRLFQILDDMNVLDGEQLTRKVAISNSFVSANKVKAGAHITIGADEQSMHDLVNEKAIAILLIIDKEEYFKRAK